MHGHIAKPCKTNGRVNTPITARLCRGLLKAYICQGSLKIHFIKWMEPRNVAMKQATVPKNHVLDTSAKFRALVRFFPPKKMGFGRFLEVPSFRHYIHDTSIYIYTHVQLIFIYIYTHVISIYIPTMEFHGPAPKTAEAAAKTPRHARAAAEAWWQMVTAAHRSAEAQRNHSPETRSGEAPCFAKGKIYRKPWFRMV